MNKIIKDFGFYAIRLVAKNAILDFSQNCKVSNFNTKS